MPLLLCPQLHSKLPHPSSFHLTTVPSPPPPRPVCPTPPSSLLGKRGVGTIASACPLPWSRDVWCECGLFPSGGNWRRSGR